MSIKHIKIASNSIRLFVVHFEVKIKDLLHVIAHAAPFPLDEGRAPPSV